MQIEGVVQEVKLVYLLRGVIFSLFNVSVLLIIRFKILKNIYQHFSLTELHGYYTAVILSVIFWILSMLSFRKFFLLLNIEQISKETDQLHLEESQKLIQTLHSQRHDFRNQLQVIGTLAQYNKHEEIVKYIQDCNSELSFSCLISSNIDNPIIFAMFLYFYTTAKEKEISFKVDSNIDFTNFSLSIRNVAKLLRNTIHYAITLLEKTMVSEKTIKVILQETYNAYFFTIHCSNAANSGKSRDQMHKPGFSIRQHTDSGLFIIKENIKSLKGKFVVNNTPDYGTEFKIMIPIPVKR